MSEPYYSDEHATLYGGDALAVLAHLADGSVDALVTDPPYSSGGQYRGDRTSGTGAKYGGERFADFAGDNRDARSYAYWSALWISEAHRVVRPGGAAVLFSDWRQLPTVTDALQAGGFVWRGVVPWVKPHSRPGYMQRAFLNVCEYAVWGTRGASTTEDGSTEPLPGFYQAPAPRLRDHQTQKPVDVMRSLVKIAPEGGVILDPFMGSGTTGVAAILEGRRFIGAELIPDHAATAERRIREALGQAVPRGSQDALDFGAAS